MAARTLIVLRNELTTCEVQDQGRRQTSAGNVNKQKAIFLKKCRGGNCLKTVRWCSRISLTRNLSLQFQFKYWNTFRECGKGPSQFSMGSTIQWLQGLFWSHRPGSDFCCRILNMCLNLSEPQLQFLLHLHGVDCGDRANVRVRQCECECMCVCVYTYIFIYEKRVCVYMCVCIYAKQVNPEFYRHLLSM